MMKKRYVFPLMWLLICLSAKAQQPLLTQDYYYTIDPATQQKKPGYENRYQYDASGRIRIIQYNRWVEQKMKSGPVNRKEIEYDQLGREVKVTYQDFLNYSDTVTSTRIIETQYDGEGRVKVYAITEMYYLNSDIYTSTFFYTYSPEGCLMQMDYQARLNGTGSNDYTVLYTYDNPCRLVLKQTTFTEESYNPTFETFYYEGNNLVLNKAYSIQGTDTVLNYEYLYAYNEHNQKITEQRTGSYLIETSYDMEGRVSLITNYTWNSLLSTWILSGNTRNMYYTNGQLQEVSYEYFSPMNSLLFRLRYEYNDAGNVSRVLTYQKFTLQGGTILEYNNEQLIYYRCDGVVVANEFYSVENGTRLLTSGNKIVYLGPAPCEQQAEQDFRIYPNPTTGPVTLMPAQPLETFVIRVFNSSGQFIREYTSEQGISPVDMDFSEFPEGIYLITLTAPGYATSARLVKI